MATTISVTVTGTIGLDEPDRMLADLAQATGASWQARAVDPGPVLVSEVIELVLTAVVGKSVEMSADAAADAVRRVVKRWRAERLDPLRTEIDTETALDADPADDENP